MSTKNFELPSDDHRELMFLSRIYRINHGKGDANRDEAVIGESVDPTTGIAKSKADLKPDSERLVGPDLVFSQWLQPDEFAVEYLRRDDGTLLKNVQALAVITLQPDPLRPGTTREVEIFRCETSERPRAEVELEHVQKHQPEWNAKIRLLQGRSALTGEEVRIVAQFKYLWERSFRIFADRGWIALEPSLAFEPVGPEGLPTNVDVKKYRRGTDDKGNIFVARVLPAGLDEAEKRISGDAYWSRPGPFSSLEGAAPDVKAAAVQSVGWAHRLYVAGE